MIALVAMKRTSALDYAVAAWLSQEHLRMCRTNNGKGELRVSPLRDGGEAVRRFGQDDSFV
jgi:hypothetical protein